MNATFKPGSVETVATRAADPLTVAAPLLAGGACDSWGFPARPLAEVQPRSVSAPAAISNVAMDGQKTSRFPDVIDERSLPQAPRGRGSCSLVFPPVEDPDFHHEGH